MKNNKKNCVQLKLSKELKKKRKIETSYHMKITRCRRPAISNAPQSNPLIRTKLQTKHIKINSFGSES